MQKNLTGIISHPDIRMPIRQGGPSDYYTDKIAKEALSCAMKVKEFAERMMQR